jgi:hypothetical protein
VLRGGVDRCTYPLLTHETLLSALLIPPENVVARYDVRARLHSEASELPSRLKTGYRHREVEVLHTSQSVFPRWVFFSRVVGLEPHPVPANCHVLGIANTERFMVHTTMPLLITRMIRLCVTRTKSTPQGEHPWRVPSGAHSGHLYL